MKNENPKPTKEKFHRLRKVFSEYGYSDRLKLPPGCGGPSQTVITGRKMAEFDGCEGLVSYEEDHITLRLSDKTVTVYGKDLSLKTFSLDHIAVCGRVYGVLEGEYREEIVFADH
jgi:sporulation protein YqfC